MYSICISLGNSRDNHMSILIAMVYVGPFELFACFKRKYPKYLDFELCTIIILQSQGDWLIRIIWINFNLVSFFHLQSSCCIILHDALVLELEANQFRIEMLQRLILYIELSSRSVTIKIFKRNIRNISLLERSKHS